MPLDLLENKNKNKTINNAKHRHTKQILVLETDCILGNVGSSLF